MQRLQRLIFKNKKLISIMLLVVIIISSLSGVVKATVDDVIDYTKKASLEIVKYENKHGTNMDSTENKPLKGVEYTIYKLDEANMEKTAEEIALGIEAGSITGLDSKSLTTGENGTIKFTELELGRYLVIETKVPMNVSVKTAPFLVDLPRTSDDGTSWNYDVKVEPKSETVYGDVTLNKTGADGNALAGTSWELQIKHDGEWIDYLNSYRKLSGAIDEITNTREENYLVTDSEGKISIANLPVGEYRLVEMATLEGYILDKSNTKNFVVTAENTSFEFTAINEKPELEKEVKNVAGYGEHTSAFKTEEVEWKITSKVPSIIEKMDTYYITDTLPKGLDYKEGSVVIEGLTLDTHYTISKENGSIKVTFNTKELAKLNKSEVVVTYKTTFNNTVEYGKALVNSANLTYTNEIDVDGTSKSTTTTKDNTAEVHTGKVLIKKTDEENNFLAGAKFKIATTESNAKDGKYVKDIDGNDIVATSDESGNVIFEGLKYGVDNSSAEEGSSLYYIVEFESPTYTDNEGNEKHYNLLKEPVEVEVNAMSGENVMATVVNKKGFTLPLTGGTGALALTILGITLIGIAIKLNKKEEKTVE